MGLLIKSEAGLTPGRNSVPDYRFGLYRFETKFVVRNSIGGIRNLVANSVSTILRLAVLEPIRSLCMNAWFIQISSRLWFKIINISLKMTVKLFTNVTMQISVKLGQMLVTPNK